MPRLGEYSDNKDLSGSRQEFVEAIGELCSVMRPLSIRQMSAQANISKAALQSMRKGTGGTRRSTLSALHSCAARYAGMKGVQVMPWADLEKLRAAAAAEHAACRGGALASAAEAVAHRAVVYCASCSSAVNALAVITAQPAKRRGRHAAIAHDVLPVPWAQGDRQHIAADNATWVEDLAAHIAAGREEDAAGILRFFGHSAPPQETATAISSCQARGLGEAVGDLLMYSAKRAEREVMGIAGALLERQQHGLAGVLLRTALDT